MHEKSAFYIIDLQRKICQQIKKQKQQGCAQLKFEGEKKRLGNPAHYNAKSKQVWAMCIDLHFFLSTTSFNKFYTLYTK